MGPLSLHMPLMWFVHEVCLAMSDFLHGSSGLPKVQKWGDVRPSEDFLRPRTVMELLPLDID